MKKREKSAPVFLTADELAELIRICTNAAILKKLHQAEEHVK